MLNRYKAFDLNRMYASLTILLSNSVISFLGYLVSSVNLFALSTVNRSNFGRREQRIPSHILKYGVESIL